MTSTSSWRRVGGGALGLNGVRVATILCAAALAPRAEAQNRPLCLSDIAAETALAAAVVSEAPSPLCEASYRIVEIRNRSGAPLGAARLELTAPDRPGEMPFEPLDETVDPPVFFEMSGDDGATWRPVGAPQRVGGRLVWTIAEAPLLARLGPNGAPDDSLLLRWRAALGEVYGGAFAPDAAIGVTGRAVDACGAVAQAPLRETILTALKPRPAGRLLGRNVTRGGPFSSTVPAAPGDRIEWRLEIDNSGEATAGGVKVETLSAGGPLTGAVRADGGPEGAFGETGVLAMDPAPAGGRQVALFRTDAPAGCGREPVVAQITYGCAATPPDRLSAIRAEGAPPRAWLVAEPDPSAIRITPSVTGGDGFATPGGVAEIRIIIVNDGAPVFDPAIEISPPDGFEIAPDAQITFRATAGVGPGRVIGARLAEAEGARSIARLTAAGGAQPILSAGDRIEIRVAATRRRATMAETDEVGAALLFADGCGAPGRTRAATARTRLRQAQLEIEAAPEGAPIVRSTSPRKTFVAKIANEGDAAAETVTMTLEPGAGWRDLAPEGCARAGSSEIDGAEGPRFVCVLEGGLGPGETREARFSLMLDPAARDAEEARAGGLSVAVAAEARSADAEGRPQGAALSVGRAETSVVGFEIRQRLTTVGGERLDPADAIDLGQRIGVEIEARWFGLGAREAATPALAVYLPPQLGALDWEQIDGDLSVVGAREPAEGASGRLLWSLGAIEGDGAAVFRVEAAVVESPVSGARDAFAASLSTGAVVADAIFDVDGRTLGVDSAADSPTAAAPLELIFRRPDLRLDLAIEGAARAETDFGEAVARDVERQWIAPPGEILVARVALRNLGAGPGYFDWVRLEAPPGVEILPFAADGLDNDADGAIDEADEAAVADLGPAFESLTGGAPIEARWSSGSGGGALGGGERLVRPEGERVWLAALRLDPDTPPGRTHQLEVEAQFGAQPVQRGGVGARSRVSIAPSIGAAKAEGWLALTETSFGGDIDSVARVGERVQHRFTLRLPPGRIAAAEASLIFDPAYGAPDRLDARFGAGVRCVGGARVESRGGAEAGRQAVWRLGDCVVDLAAPPEARSIIFDVAARLRDADPDAASEIRRSWRRPRLVGRLSFDDSAAPGGRRTARLGESRLTLSGPAPRLIMDPVRTADGAEALDAGDGYAATLRLANIGDAPTEAAVVRYGWPAPAGAPLGATHVACDALEITSAEARLVTRRVGPCLIEARLDFSQAPFAPGEVVEMRLAGALTPTAPIGGEVVTPLEAALAPSGAVDLDALALFGPEAPRARRLWRKALRPPAEPEIELARPDARLAIGDTVLARGRFAIPEGRGAFDLLLRFRFEGRDGRAAPSFAPILDSLALALDRDRPDLTAETVPPASETGEAAIQLDPEAYSVTLASDGWTTIRAPLGRVALESPGDGLGAGTFLLELTGAVADAPAASRGRRLVGQAVIVAAGAAETADPPRRWSSAKTLVAEIAEPFLDLAALHEDADGSAQLGERVVFVGRVCNRGAAPAYGAVLRGVPPSGFALDPDAPPLYVFDDGPEALGPRPYGQVAIGADGVLVGLSTDATPIEPGACVALRMPAFAESPAHAGRTAEGVFSTHEAEARFEVVRYRGRPAASAPGRVYPGSGASAASVARRDLLIEGPDAAFLGEDGWIRHPFTIQQAGRLGGEARLSLFLSGADDLTWTIFLDVNRDGAVDSGDTVWRDGQILPLDGGLAFVARARPTTAPPIGWRRTAFLRAAAALGDGRLLTGARELVAARGSQRDGVMSAVRVMAIDRDCDGRLDDEAAQDAAFERSKEVARGECVVMRILFRNDGAASVERVQVEDVVPEGARFLEGSARFAATPSGLVGRGVDRPDAIDAARSGRARLRFRFVGALAPGLEGAVEYRIRISAIR